MATTTNYGWSTPDDTALVSAGASAIRTLGSAIDTTLGGLKGIKQIVAASYATQTSSSSSTYADTGLTANITCATTNSKVLVIVVHASSNRSSANVANALNLRLVRGVTTLETHNRIGATNTASDMIVGDTFVYLDSPASTAALTYKTQLASNNNTASVATAFNADTIRMFLIELER